jgi:hypothetical protein
MMDIQIIIVFAIIAIAIVYLFRTIFNSFKGQTCETSANCGCNSKIQKHKKSSL